MHIGLESACEGLRTKAYLCFPQEACRGQDVFTTGRTWLRSHWWGQRSHEHVLLLSLMIRVLQAQITACTLPSDHSKKGSFQSHWSENRWLVWSGILGNVLHAPSLLNTFSRPLQGSTFSGFGILQTFVTCHCHLLNHCKVRTRQNKGFWHQNRLFENLCGNHFLTFWLCSNICTANTSVYWTFSAKVVLHRYSFALQS